VGIRQDFRDQFTKKFTLLLVVLDFTEREGTLFHFSLPSSSQSSVRRRENTAKLVIFCSPFSFYL